MDAMQRLDGVIIPGLQRLFEGTGADQLDARTPCDEWQVRDLMGHLVGGGHMFAAAFAGAPMDMSGGGDPLGGDPGGAFAAAAGAFSTAAGAPGAMERTVTLPFGDMPAPVVIELAGADLLVHSWDLASATGQPFEPPTEVVEAAETFLRGFLQPSLRGAMFAAEVAVPADAPPLARLVGFTGRRP